MTDQKLLEDAEKAIQGMREYFEEEKTKVMTEAEALVQQEQANKEAIEVKEV
jgi:hypothetical protein